MPPKINRLSPLPLCHVHFTDNFWAQKLKGWSNDLYRSDDAQYETFDFKAILYFAWTNREMGEMVVWVREGG